MSSTLLCRAVVGLSVCVSLPGSTVAQDQHWLDNHRKGNRYEGFLDRPNAKHNLELLGFYAFRQPVEEDRSTLLHVAFYLPEDEPVYLEAREIYNHAQYRMQALDQAIARHSGGWSYFGDWPVRDVLLPNHIPLTNLGVTIRLKSDNEFARDLAPAILYADPRPDAPPRNIAVDAYSMYLLVNKPLSSLTYQLLAPSVPPRLCTVNPFSPHLCKATEKTAPTPVPSGAIVKLEFARAGLQSAPHTPTAVTVRILGHIANSAETVQAEFAFEDADLPNP